MERLVTTARLMPGNAARSDDLAWDLLQQGTLTVDETGAIWRANGKRAETVDPQGYGRVFLGRYFGKRRFAMAHRIVWMATRGAIPSPALQVNHVNGRRWDNRPDNLDLVTAKGNGRHAHANPYFGVPAVGEIDSERAHDHWLGGRPPVSL